MKVATTRKGQDKAVGVVIGALLLTVILFAALSAYILYYVPSTVYSNETASLVSEQNGFLSLSQKVTSPPYPGSIISGNIPLGYGGVPPFSAPTQGTLSYSNNSSLFQAYLNYTYTVNLVNSTLSSILQPNQVAILPITITSSVQQTTAFDERLAIDSATYKGIESGNLSNIFFTYTNGTVVPSWLENNNTNSSTSTTYWLKLGPLAANSPVVVDMVFLPTSINIMNPYQTGEASQLSPVFGQYNDMSSVFGIGLEYQFYACPNNQVNAQGYQGTLYKSPLAKGTIIAVTGFSAHFNYGTFYFNSYSDPFFTALVGSSQIVHGTMENNVIVNNESGYTGGSSYPTNAISSPSNSFLSKTIGFVQVNTSTIFYGGMDDGMSMGYSSYSSANGASWLNSSATHNLFGRFSSNNGYRTDQGTITSPGTYSFEMNYFQYYNKAYTALWTNTSVSYYHPLFPVGSSYPTATLGNVAIKNLTSVPITITNKQSSSEPNIYQQRLVINNAQYQAKEAANLQNIIFTYTNGTIIPSWLETGNSNTSTQTEYWLSMAGMPADSSVTINMLILPQQLNMFNNFRTGESPQYSSGIYDDGSFVFPFYDSGNSVSQFSTVNAGSLTSSQQNGPFGSSVSAISLSGPTTSTGPSESVAWISNELGGDLILQSWVYLDGNENAMMAARGSSDTSNINYIMGDGWAGQQAQISYEQGNSNTYLSGSGSRSTSWCFVTSELNGSKLSVNVSKGPLGVGSAILAQTSATSTTITASNSQYAGIAVWSGSNSPAYFYLLRAITLPANGVMPTVSTTQKVSNATNLNVIVQRSSLQVYGNFNSKVGATSHGTSLYLADGSTILTDGTQKLLGNIIPINVTSTSFGMNLSVSAVSIIGSNISTSVDGSSLIRLSNVNSTTFSFYKGEELSLLYHDSIPYTAEVGSINLTSFSYVVTGILAPAFNYTMYSMYGNGQIVSVSGHWYIGSGAFLVTSNENVFSIALSTSYTLLNSINTNYAAYALLDI